MSRDMRFPTMWYVRPAKTQISLCIHAVWSEPFLVAWIFYECNATDWTSFWVSKLKRGLRRLVWFWADPRDSWHLHSSLLFILTRVPTHKKYRILCYPLRSNSGWLPIRCAYFILLVPLIMTLSRGHTGQIKRIVIMRWKWLPYRGNKVVPWRD